MLPIYPAPPVTKTCMESERSEVGVECPLKSGRLPYAKTLRNANPAVMALKGQIQPQPTPRAAERRSDLSNSRQPETVSKRSITGAGRRGRRHLHSLAAELGHHGSHMLPALASLE